MMAREQYDVTIDMSQVHTSETLRKKDESPVRNEIRNEAGQRLCPLCQSIIRPFFVNFNEKFIMCENTACDFPFGYEQFQFVREDEDFLFDDDEINFKSHSNVPQSTTWSVGSRAWSEIDKINNASECEENPLEGQSLVETDKSKERKRKMATEENIKKNIQDIKELSEELNVESGTQRKIKNEKWIKNLKNLQEISGVQLLKPEEMGLLKKEEPTIGLGELTIDIAPASNASMSSIRIEIHNSSESRKSDTDLGRGDLLEMSELNINSSADINSSLDINSYVDNNSSADNNSSVNIITSADLITSADINTSNA